VACVRIAAQCRWNETVHCLPFDVGNETFAQFEINIATRTEDSCS
jgi:hypothetical protein